MANLEMSVQLNAPADKVWGLIGGFDALPRWHPAVATSGAAEEGGKTLRRLGLHGGGTIVESLEHHDAGARRYTYRILSGPLPVADYRAELSVDEQGGERCRVRWSSEFKPDGVPEPEAVETIRGVYKAGFDSLKERFGG
jgi:hypothetical protein